ncbi:MAG TPA: hypothetical protein VGB55_09105, partial [Tepidisphaeraceae bacterium]
MTACRCGVLLALIFVGCDRAPDAPPPVEPSPKAQEVQRPPPVRERTPAVFFVNDQPFAFPPAKLVIKPIEDDRLQVAVFSDDPPEAVRADYRGNSFYFDAAVDTDATADLAGKTVTYRNDPRERLETTTGLFISGGRQILQPLRATITFEKLEDEIIAHID